MGEWELKPLGDLCDVVGGGTPPKDTPEYYGGDIPWATVRDMRSDVIHSTEFKITNAAVTASSTNVIPAGNVVIATRVGLGKVCFVDQPTAINQDLRGIIPRNSQQLTVRYLYWWLKSVAHVIQQEGTGATVQGVKLPFVKSLGIPVCSIDEQHRIVAILDEAFEAIATAKANTEKNLRNARELSSSALSMCFSGGGIGWTGTTLGEVGKVRMCKRVFKEETSTTGDVPFYKIGTFGGEPDAFISRVMYDDLRSRYSFPSTGSILVSAAGTIGRRVKYDGEPAYFQDSNIVWIENDETLVLNEYLYHFYGACDWNSTIGATISRLYNDDLRRIKISFPDSIDEQRRIVAKLNSLSSEFQVVEELGKVKLAALDELKQSLLHQAFSGQLTARLADRTVAADV